MRVLVVSPHPIFPLSHGGRVRTFRLAAGLARAGASVDLVGPWSRGQRRGPQVQDGVRCHARPFATAPLLAMSDDVLPSSLPFSLEARLPLAAPLLRHTDSYDVVQVEMAGGGAWLLRSAASAARVYDAHNVDADFARERAGGSSLRGRIAERVAELERRVVEASDLVLACTERDARRLAELFGPAHRTVEVPNGFDDSLLTIDRNALRASGRRRLGVPGEERLLLFVGGSAHHNMEAVRLLEELLVPRLPTGTRLVIVGKAARTLRSRHPRVLTLRYVADLRELLASVDVALNPVSYGSGSNIKVAEYLAAGLPVVSSAVGMRGFERWSDRFRIAEVNEIPGALQDLPERSGPPAGIEELAWGSVGRRLHDRYRALLEERGSSARSSS